MIGIAKRQKPFKINGLQPSIIYQFIYLKRGMLSLLDTNKVFTKEKQCFSRRVILSMSKSKLYTMCTLDLLFKNILKHLNNISPMSAATCI